MLAPDTESTCRGQTDRQTDVLMGKRYLNLEADLHISANVNTPQQTL